PSSPSGDDRMPTAETAVTATTFPFADGRYRFWLGMKQIEELERLCGTRDHQGRHHPKSALSLYDAISASFERDGTGGLVWSGFGNHLAHEANEVLRLGLIGGNLAVIGDEEFEVGPVRAGELVALYGYPERPMKEVAA